MAITVAAITDVDWNLAPGLKVKGVRVTMDSSYTGSGEACDLSTSGSLSTAGFPNKVYGAIPMSDSDGRPLSFEPGSSYTSSAGKIFARETTSTTDHSAFPHVAATTDLSSVVCDFLVIGN